LIKSRLIAALAPAVIACACALPPPSATVTTSSPVTVVQPNQFVVLANRAQNGDNQAAIILAALNLKAGNTMEAAKWLRMAADRGFPPGEAGLGHLYAFGLGVPQDYSLALKYSRMAADQNDGIGLNNMGYLYEHGLGVPAQPAEAAGMYRRAAMQGNPVGQDNLGRCYEQGIGVPVDHQLGYFWDSLAASHAMGPELAIVVRRRDSLLASLPPDVVTRLQSAATNWKPGTEPPPGHPISPVAAGAHSA
jgi:TPR repeat protein